MTTLQREIFFERIVISAVFGFAAGAGLLFGLVTALVTIGVLGP